MADVNVVSMGMIGNLQNMNASKTTAASDAGKSFEHVLNSANSSESSNPAEKDTIMYSKQQDENQVQDLTKESELPADENALTDNTVSDQSSKEMQSIEKTDDSISDAVEEVSLGIKEVVKNTLSIDEETLNRIMEMMGIVPMDLLNTEVIQQFTLEVNGGGEVMDFLTNENIMQDFLTLTDALADFEEDNHSLIVQCMEVLEQPEAFSEVILETLDNAKASTLEEPIESQLPEDSDGQADIMQNVTEGEDVVLADGQDKLSDESVTVTKVQTAAKETVVEKEVSKEGKETMSNEDVSIAGTEETQSESGTFSQSEESESAFTERKDTVAEQLVTEPGQVMQGNVSEVFEANMKAVPRMQQMIDIVNQVSEQIRTQVTPDTTSVEMQLNPENLGKVVLNVVAKNGVMTANFQVESDEAKHALESQMYTLKENLEAKNIKVEAVEVQVSDFSFGQSNQADAKSENDFGKAPKKKFRYDVEDETDAEAENVSETEAVRRQVMRDMGGSIDFTA